MEPAGIIIEDRMNEADELQIIRRIVDGEIEAFEQIVLHYQDRLVRMIDTLLNDERRHAEDLAQIVFVEAFRRLKDFDPARSRFSNWLFMIARSRSHFFNTLRPRHRLSRNSVPTSDSHPHHRSTCPTDPLRLLRTGCASIGARQPR